LHDGIAKRWGAKYGVDLKISFPNDDFAAFMGKSTQIIALSSLEAARLVGRRGPRHRDVGEAEHRFPGVLCADRLAGQEPGRPERQEDRHRRVGHRVGPDRDHTDEAVLGTRSAEGLPGRDRLLAGRAPGSGEGRRRDGLERNAPHPGVDGRGKIRPILSTYATEWAKRRGTGHLISISLWASFGKWLKKNEKAARAVLGATQEAMDYINKNTRSWAGRYRDFIQDKATDSQVATFVDWWRKVQPSYKNAYLDEKFIRGETEFLKMAVEAGFIKPKGVKKGL
jgi:hypothetical protein